jgi:histone H3/H4
MVASYVGIFTWLTKEMDPPLLIRTSQMMPTPVLERQMMEEFWRKKEEEIEAIEDFGERAIPVTRLRKLIGAEKGNMMMTFDTPSFLTKACEIFVQELSFRASMCASSHHRSIILDADVAEAIATRVLRLFERYSTCFPGGAELCCLLQAHQEALQIL